MFFCIEVFPALCGMVSAGRLVFFRPPDVAKFLWYTNPSQRVLSNCSQRRYKIRTEGSVERNEN